MIKKDRLLKKYILNDVKTHLIKATEIDQVWVVPDKTFPGLWIKTDGEEILIKASSSNEGIERCFKKLIFFLMTEVTDISNLFDCDEGSYTPIADLNKRNDKK